MPFLSLLQIHHFRFEVVGEFLYIPIILLRGLVAILRAVYASLQSVFRHRSGIGILVGLQFQPYYNIVGTQPHGVGRLLAVSLFRPFLHFPTFALSLDNGDECNVYVRRFLTPMQVSRYDVLLCF